MNKIVFLDRDGTINVEKNYLYRIEDFEYMPNAVKGMKKLYDAGYLLIVITNQSGIARGFYTESDYESLMNWMCRDLADKGIAITDTYYCPHLPGAAVPRYNIKCGCRKPGTALFWEAARKYSADLGASYAIGDKLRDLSICGESEVRGILLDHQEENRYPGIWVCADMDEAADIILG